MLEKNADQGAVRIRKGEGGEAWKNQKYRQREHKSLGIRSYLKKVKIHLLLIKRITQKPGEGKR